ncbi:hypothetical protein, partial [Paraglaciecola sp.]|uniref:hypothetical protein n=1 Tax=Paraglaciecola sp. TaxID=1920173 RepID=UPI00329A43D9
MPIKPFMLVTIATVSVLFSTFTLAQSDKVEAKKAEVQNLMQQRIEDRCGEDQDCIAKMKSRMAEKGGAERGDRDSAKQQMLIEKRCGDDQD